MPPFESRHSTASPELLLEQARTADLAGAVAVAIRGYGRAIQVAADSGATVVLADGLRCLSVLYHRRNEPETARALCTRSLELGRKLADGRLIGHALNTLAGCAFESGDMTGAGRLFEAALEAAAAHPVIAARVEQNLGMLHAVKGDLDQAIDHYHLSLRAHDRAGD